MVHISCPTRLQEECLSWGRVDGGTRFFHHPTLSILMVLSFGYWGKDNSFSDIVGSVCFVQGGIFLTLREWVMERFIIDSELEEVRDRVNQSFVSLNNDEAQGNDRIRIFAWLERSTLIEEQSAILSHMNDHLNEEDERRVVRSLLTGGPNPTLIWLPLLSTASAALFLVYKRSERLSKGLGVAAIFGAMQADTALVRRARTQRSADELRGHKDRLLQNS